MGLKYILVFLFLGSYNFLFAQINFSQTEFDLGEIVQLDQDIVDLNLSNASNKDLFLLRMAAPSHVSIKYTSKKLEAGEAQLLRVKLNPKETGRFKQRIKIFLSTNEDPIVLTFKGEVKNIVKNNKTACPDFSKNQKPQVSLQLFQQQSGQKKQFFISLSEENQNQELAEISQIQEAKTPNPTPRRTKTKRVRKTPEERRNSPSVLEMLFGNEDSSAVAEVDPVEETPIIDTIEETVVELKVPLKEKLEAPSANLLSDDFKPNHVVFLIDASTSMREEERMEILKLAMIELLEPLRDIDYLSIVTYSGEAKVVLPPTSAVNKEKIKESIENIVADGSTQAVKGIQKAIQLSKSNFLEEGNNQILLATDGAFDIGKRNERLRKKIKSTAEDGVLIGVLGIKNAKWTNKSLKEIVELGQGSFLKINSKKDASRVLEEVKKRSLK